MKRLKLFFLLAIPIFNAGFSSRDNYILSNDYSITIHGTSNHDDWDETVEKVTGGGEVNLNTDGSFDLNAISIKMDAHSIKSKSSIMDSKTYKALKADANPEILFILNTPVKSIKTISTGNTLTAKGNLTIAGVTRTVNMLVKVFMPEKGKLSFQGSQILKETDYGISPPTALFGMLKTGDDIILNFKTNFILSK